MRVGVCGAAGRMGREVCRAVISEEGLELVCAVDTACAGMSLSEMDPGIASGLEVTGRIEDLVESGVNVLVDFSVADAARVNVSYALGSGINCVVGTTGLEDGDLLDFREKALGSGAGCLVAPNFAVGAVLMMEFARLASRYMDSCEIVELHHSAKLDAPSGTALGTARLILEEKGESAGGEQGGESRGLEIGGMHIHSVRLPGLVAHQEVIFGGRGQTLTIRHDSLDRTSFMPGVIMAIREISGVRGLVVGLGKLMGFE